MTLVKELKNTQRGDSGSYEEDGVLFVWSTWRDDDVDYNAVAFHCEVDGEWFEYTGEVDSNGYPSEEFVAELADEMRRIAE